MPEDVCGQKSKYIFCKHATLEHAFAQIKGRLSDDEMIGAIFDIAPEKYKATFNLVAENQGDTLQVSYMEAAIKMI